jgi:hypothetical protein
VNVTEPQRRGAILRENAESGLFFNPSGCQGLGLKVVRSAQIAGDIIILESLTVNDLHTLKRVSILSAEVAAIWHELNGL